MKVIVVLLVCCVLSGCAALSAVKGLLGDGDNNSTDRSLKVEANLAARDNKKAIVSHEMTRTYQNKGNVVSNGVQVRGNSLVGIIAASAAQGIDLLVMVLGWLVYRGFCKYMDVRADIWERKFKLKMEKIRR
jgi:hypothetical protein